MFCNMFGRNKRRLADIEGAAGEIPIQEVLDYDDASWVIDHHGHNLIQKISKPDGCQAWYEAPGHFGRKESAFVMKKLCPRDNRHKFKLLATMNRKERWNRAIGSAPRSCSENWCSMLST